MDVFKNIVDATAQTTGVSHASILGKSRKRKIVDARKIIVWYARMNRYTVIDIGKRLNRHHTSILNLTQSYLSLFQTDEQFKSHSQAVDKKLRSLKFKNKIKRINAMKKNEFLEVPPLWPEEATNLFNFDINTSVETIKACVCDASKEADNAEYDFLNDFQLITSNQMFVESIVVYAFGYEIPFNHHFIPAEYE